MASPFRLYAMRLLETALCSEKKDVGMGHLCGLATPYFACTLPSLHLVSVGYIALSPPTSFFAIVELVLNTCLCASFLYYRRKPVLQYVGLTWLINIGFVLHSLNHVIHCRLHDEEKKM